MSADELHFSLTYPQQMQISKGYLKDRLVVTILKPEMFVGNVSHSILLPELQQIEIEIPLQFPSSGEEQVAALIS